MCTAISFTAGNHFFGRNLDLDQDFGQQVTVVPRHFPLSGIEKHDGVIGMAVVIDGYPLFFEGTNEAGLSVAALNFPGNAVYHKAAEEKVNIPSYDVISYLLTRCATCQDVKALLENAVICDDPYAENTPTTPLHWLIADRNQALVAESTVNGLQIYDNPIKVLTNNPPFPYHMDNLCRYMDLHNGRPDNRLAPTLPLEPFSLGMGAIGLPGDFSSPSRFIRAAFVRHNSPQNANTAISQFFRILDAASVPDGCVKTDNGFQTTRYCCCCDTDHGIYYYTTAHNRQISAVNMQFTDLDGNRITQYPIKNIEQINWLNS